MCSVAGGVSAGTGQSRTTPTASAIGRATRPNSATATLRAPTSGSEAASNKTLPPSIMPRCSSATADSTRLPGSAAIRPDLSRSSSAGSSAGTAPSRLETLRFAYSYVVATITICAAAMTRHKTVRSTLTVRLDRTDSDGCSLTAHPRRTRRPLTQSVSRSPESRVAGSGPASGYAPSQRRPLAGPIRPEAACQQTTRSPPPPRRPKAYQETAKADRPEACPTQILG